MRKMKMNRQWLFLFAVLGFACSDENEPDPSEEINCDDITVTAEVTATAECDTETGAIAASAAEGSGSYEFSLNGGTFSSGNTFTGLAPGSYDIIVRDENNCRDTTTVLINSGISFSASVHPIIESNCAVSGCHVDGEQQLPNFQVTSNIISNATGIGNNVGAGTMPPSGSGQSLTDEERQLIVCWANDGGPDN